MRLDHRFSIDVSHAQLDVSRCATSGQMFRWQRLPSGRWLGIDGDAIYAVAQTDFGIEVESNRPPERLRSLFQLDQPEDVVAEIVRRGPELAPFAAGHAGHRLLQPECLRETFFGFLCSANNHLRRIVPMNFALATFGEPVEEVEGQVVHAWPSLDQIASVPEERLRELGFGYRAATIPRAARTLLEMGGEQEMARWRDEPYAQVRAKLLSVPGVGPKLADCIGLFGLHRREVVPIDTHLWQVLTRLYFPDWVGTSLTPLKYATASEFMQARFGRLAGWAHQLMFVESMTRGGKKKGSVA